MNENANFSVALNFGQMIRTLCKNEEKAKICWWYMKNQRLGSFQSFKFVLGPWLIEIRKSAGINCNFLKIDDNLNYYAQLIFLFGTSMQKNNVPVEEILEDLGIDPKPSEKQLINDFAVSYAQKLVKKCIQLKHGIATSKKIKVEDVKYTYEAIKMIHSPEMSEKIQEKKRAIIQNSKNHQLEEESVSRVNTVKLLLSSELEHMMTNKQYQLTFQ